MQSTPSTPKAFTLGGLSQLQTGTKYLEQSIKDIKYELEAIHGIPMQKISNENVLLLTCCNAKLNIKEQEEKYFEKCSTQKKIPSKSKYLEKVNQNSRQNYRDQNWSRSKCTYYVKFSVLKNTMRPAQKSTYELLDFNLEHDPECYCDQNIAFYKIIFLLNSSAPAIEKIVCRKISKKQQFNSPKAIQEILSTQLGLSHDFLQKDLPQGSSYKRRIKKKFDNMIAEAKRSIVDPKKYIEKQQYAKLYPEAFKANQVNNHRRTVKSKQQIEYEQLQSQSPSPPQKKQEEYHPRIDARKRRNFHQRSSVKNVEEKNIKNINHSQFRSQQLDDQFQSSKPRKRKNIDSQFQARNQLQQNGNVEEKNKRNKFEVKEIKNVDLNQTPFKKEDQVLNQGQIKESQVNFNEVLSENPLRIQEQSNMEIEQPDGSPDYSMQYYYDNEKKAKVLLKQKSARRKKNSPSSKTSGKDSKRELEQNSDKLGKTKLISKIRNTKNSGKRHSVQQKNSNAQTTAKKTDDQEQRMI